MLQCVACSLVVCGGSPSLQWPWLVNPCSQVLQTTLCAEEICEAAWSGLQTARLINPNTQLMLDS